MMIPSWLVIFNWIYYSRRIERYKGQKVMFFHASMKHMTF